MYPNDSMCTSNVKFYGYFGLSSSPAPGRPDADGHLRSLPSSANSPHHARAPHPVAAPARSDDSPCMHNPPCPPRFNPPTSTSPFASSRTHTPPRHAQPLALSAPHAMSASLWLTALHSPAPVPCHHHSLRPLTLRTT
jgi:hypothetical protein